MKSLFLLLFMALIWLPLCSADELVLTTYYPAPNGQYFNMNVSNLLTANNVDVTGTLTVATLRVTGNLTVDGTLSVQLTSQLMGNVGVGQHLRLTSYKLLGRRM